MADSHTYWSIMRTEWWSANGSESRWPRCVVGSGLAHVALLGLCLLSQPVSEQTRPTLRVTFVEEAPVPSGPTVAETLPVPSAAQIATPLPRTSRRSASLSLPPVVATRPAPAPLAEFAPEPLSVAAPLPHFPVPAVPGPPPAAAASPVAPPITSSTGQSQAEHLTEAMGPRGAAEDWSSQRVDGDMETLSRPQASASGVRGPFLVSEQGNGRGVGTGSAIGAGGGAAAGQKTGEGRGNGANSGHGPAGAPGALAYGGGGVVSSRQDAAELLRIIARQIGRVWTYPDDARREGLQGTVELRFRVAADGSIETVEIIRSSGHAALDEAAIRALRKGGPYPVYGGWLRYPFTYRLDR